MRNEIDLLDSSDDLNEESDFSYTLFWFTFIAMMLTLGIKMLQNADRKIRAIGSTTPIDYNNAYFNALVVCLFSYVNHRGLKAINFDNLEIKDNSMVLVHPHITGGDPVFVQAALTKHETEQGIDPHRLYFLGTDMFPKIPIFGFIFKWLYDVTGTIQVPNKAHKDLREILEKIPVAGIMFQLLFNAAHKITGTNGKTIENQKTLYEIAQETEKLLSIFISGALNRRGKPPVRIKSGFSYMSEKGKELVVLKLGLEGIENVSDFVRDNPLYLFFLSFWLAKDITVEHLKTISFPAVDVHLPEEERQRIIKGLYKEVTELFGQTPVSCSQPVTPLKTTMAPPKQKPQKLAEAHIEEAVMNPPVKEALSPMKP